MEEVKKYAFHTVLDASYEDAIVRVKNALKDEGFGVLTEIDVKETLEKKLVSRTINYFTNTIDYDIASL